MPAQYITSKKLHTLHHLTNVPMSSQLIRQLPRVSQCLIDRRRRERSNHLPVRATYYRETDASFNLLLARHGPLMHECMHAYSGRAIPKGHLQFMPAGAYRQAVRLVSPLHFSASLPSHAFPCGRTDLGHGSTMSRTRMYHACVERARPMFESPPRSKRQVQFSLTSQHLSVSGIQLPLVYHCSYNTHSALSTQQARNLNAYFKSISPASPTWKSVAAGMQMHESRVTHR